MVEVKAGNVHGVRHTRLAVSRSFDPLVILGVLLLLDCAPVSNTRKIVWQ